MENMYKIVKIAEEQIIDWDNIESAEIGQYFWEKNGYCPEAYAKMCYSDSAIHVLLGAFEKEPKTLYTGMNDPVYKDSCLEFFVQPVPPGDGRFLNFELNSKGTLLLGIGNKGDGRILIDKDVLHFFEIKTDSREENGQNVWEVVFCIPYVFLIQLFPGLKIASGVKMRGNFFKCGDETAYPHFGCWNPIVNEYPNFHLPEFFGILVLA